jgi:hypothetical protein
MVDFPDIHDRSKFPGMTHWFSPSLLARLLLKVVLSDVFGQFADRRLTVAALDTYPTDELMKRTKVKPNCDESEEIWFDFVADLGDGFDATYAIASLLAQEKLKFDGMPPLPRGEALVMGGDEIYPLAEHDAYRFQLHTPYKMAFPDHNHESDDGTPIYAVPGNHDWYDGLVMFLAFFAAHKPTRFGSWRTKQRRSYFALQLTKAWWLWATDIQLADDMDQPQADYFTLIAKEMLPNSRIILCSAEPGWLYTLRSYNSYEILDFAASIVRKADKNLTIPIVLSGDTHHYSRYSSEHGVQFITAGGGGAFLHPTHQLEDQISQIRLKDTKDQLTRLTWWNKAITLSLKTTPSADHAPTQKVACYPSRQKSRSLLKGNLWFALTNWDFSLLMGGIYFVFALGIYLRMEWDAYLITWATFFGSLFAYTRYQERIVDWKTWMTSALQALAHTYAIGRLLDYILPASDHVAAQFCEYGLPIIVNIAAALGHPMSGGAMTVTSNWFWLATMLVLFVVMGGLVGATIYGFNLLVTCLCFGMNSNDAFSSMRLDSYKNFLRLHIKGNEVTIYPVGLDAVPKRGDWIKNPNAADNNPNEPWFLPKQPLVPHLIEDPIEVRT